VLGIKIGDLVKMKGSQYDTGIVGIVVDRDYHHSSTQIAIKWFGGSGKVDWEPETWLEMISESR
jgi:hypothetical protein